MDTNVAFGENHDDSKSDRQCRTCLVQHGEHQVYSLNSKNLTVMEDGCEQTIAEIYHQCTQLLYEPLDAHPKWICQNCTEKMIEFFQFRKMCIDSYTRLSEVMSSMNSDIKMEVNDVSDNTANDDIELSESIVIKPENDFESDNIQLTKKMESNHKNADDEDRAENSSLNSVAKGSARSSLTLRKRTKTTVESAATQATTEKVEDANRLNDDNDSDFNGFDDYDDSDDESSDDSTISDPKVKKFTKIRDKIELYKIMSFAASDREEKDKCNRQTQRKCIRKSEAQRIHVLVR